MRHTVALLVVLALTACDLSKELNAGKFAIFETSKGVVYRLNTSTGETEIIYSPEGWPTLKAQTLYRGEDDKTYEYLGGGRLKELSTSEVADRLVKKYAK